MLKQLNQWRQQLTTQHTIVIKNIDEAAES